MIIIYIFQNFDFIFDLNKQTTLRIFKPPLKMKRKNPPTGAELKYNTLSFEGKSTMTTHYRDTCVKFVWQ